MQPMIWQASFLPLAVLVEAWSRATGLPALFYMDAFHGLLLGLLHKDITTDVAGFKCRSRYWAVGTAQPGSGKSPAVDPMVEALQEVLEQHPDLAAGEAWDKFHICDPKTHCATVDKLRDADGYLTVVAGEGGPLLCPSWPSSATWNQTTHVNLQRFLNSANGGSVPWENAIERKGKKQAMEEQVRASPNVPGDRTNVSIVLFQQCSVFSNWWAAGELKQAIGLPQRCVFSFGAVREPGPPWLQGFESEVVIPLLKRGFLWILKTLGPKAPLSDRTPGLSWRLGSVCRDVFWRYRLKCFDANQKTHFGETFASGVNKSAYWVGTVALLGTLMEQLWPAMCSPAAAVEPWSGELSSASFKMAATFFHNRFLYGLAVLEVDMRRRARAATLRKKVVHEARLFV